MENNTQGYELAQNNHIGSIGIKNNRRGHIRELEKECPGLKFVNNGSHANKQGTLFMINERILELKREQLEEAHKVLIPNRASQLKIEWGEGQSLNLINIYSGSKNCPNVLAMLTICLTKG